MTEKDPNQMWGGRFAAVARRAHGRDKCLDRLRQGTGAAGHPRLEGARRHAGGARASSPRRMRADIMRGLDQVLAEIESGRFAFSTQARGHPPEHREPADRADRPGRRPPAHGALAQRSGRARFPPVCARRARCLRRGADGPAAGARRKGRGACGHRHAGLHAPAAGAAGDLRPSSAGLCRDARARSRPVRRCPRAAQREPARLGGAGRHVVPHRPARDGARARLRPADGQFARRRLRSRFRARNAGRGGDFGHAPVAARRGDRDLDDAAVRLRPALRPLDHRLLDHAAEAQSRCRRARAAPRSAASPAPSRAC